MGNYLWIPAFAFMLGILVFFHELGHFTLAKIMKIRVDEFAFGFGPEKLRFKIGDKEIAIPTKWILFKRGDTEYTIHLVPMGGFVKLAGENPGEPAVEGGFSTRPWYQRYLVYLAGPTFSLLLAFLVFCALGMTVGLPITGKAINQVDLIMPDSRAEHAGLKIGDRIIEVNGIHVANGNQLVDYIHNNAEKPLTITVARNHQTLTLHATPKATIVKDEKGQPLKDKTGKPKSVGLLGFIPRQELTRVGPVMSVKFGALETERYVETLVVVMFSKEAAKNVGGPIAIADETSKSVKRGWNGFLQLIAILSLSLGVINLMPIPVMDGGWMLLAVMEGIKGRRLADKTMVIAQFIGLALIAVLFVSVFYLDIQRLLKHQLFQ